MLRLKLNVRMNVPMNVRSVPPPTLLESITAVGGRGHHHRGQHGISHTATNVYTVCLRQHVYTLMPSLPYTDILHIQKSVCVRASVLPRTMECFFYFYVQAPDSGDRDTATVESFRMHTSHGKANK